MSSFICKQPNGLYCRFSFMVDGITHYNMTAEDYIEMCAERARKEARDVLENHLRPFSDVKKFFSPDDDNNTVEMMNEILKEMGDDEPIELPCDVYIKRKE